MTPGKHIPVLLEEVINFIQPQSNANYIDATLGGGGYTERLLQENKPQGQVMCFDLDQSAILLGQKKFIKDQNRIIFINDNFSKIKTKINEYKFFKIGGIVCDLGYSTLQIEDDRRGFSFKSEGELDLRFSTQTALTATEILQEWSGEKIADILKRYGEEPLAKKIAQLIVTTRQKTKITGRVLREIVERVYVKKWSTPSRIHPATRTWQALRIEVNQELIHLQNFLVDAVAVMPPGSRLAIVSFHSLEDKIVKHYFQQEAKDCICPKELAKCICQHRAQLKILTKKPVVASEQEVSNNPRSRSAKLRVIEKLNN